MCLFCSCTNIELLYWQIDPQKLDLLRVFVMIFPDITDDEK